MHEIVLGVLHWTRRHPRIGKTVSSYLLVHERIALDPIEPEEGFGALPLDPEHVVLTNRHHLRAAPRLVERCGCPVWVSEPGLPELAGVQGARPFRFGDELPGGLVAHEVGALCPDETALHVPRDVGLLAVADGVVREGDGPLGFVPDALLGDDPEEVKRGLRAAYGRLLELDFDHLLLAHGEPLVGGAKDALRRFVGA